jgi:hypothetical protein
MKKFILDNWGKYCANAITSKVSIALTPQLISHINGFDFSIFRAKQPIDLIKEHAQTRFHLTVFGLPLINRPKPPKPPSLVAPGETEYVRQLYEVVGEDLGIPVHDLKDLVHADAHIKLFDRSRITFYCAEGLKELARDQMADTAFFDTLLDEFSDGLYHSYSAPGVSGLFRLRSTVQAAQSLQLGSHVLAPHVLANDREGICHQLANGHRLEWCKP